MPLQVDRGDITSRGGGLPLPVSPAPNGDSPTVRWIGPFPHFEDSPTATCTRWCSRSGTSPS